MVGFGEGFLREVVVRAAGGAWGSTRKEAPGKCSSKTFQTHGSSSKDISFLKPECPGGMNSTSASDNIGREKT